MQTEKEFKELGQAWANDMLDIQDCEIEDILELMWFYRPEDSKSYSRGSKSIDDIRSIYGSQRVQPQQRQNLSA